MGQREFEITIGKDGTVDVHITGYKGKSCSEAVKLFEQIVGEIRERQNTSELYEPEEQVQFRIDQRV
jgi:hypothetical protein